MKTDECPIPSIPTPMESGDVANTGGVNLTSEHRNSECSFRNTCKMPENHCSKGRCDDWFF